MNRRNILFAALACGLGGLVAPLARAAAERKVISRKRLGATATTLRFTPRDIPAGGELYLQSTGNALWVESARWQDQNGLWQQKTVKRNLIPGQAFSLNLGDDCKSLEFSITTLPLATQWTEVTLFAPSFG
ncbi:MAG: hypothetical protein ACKVP5_18140 [Aestuariivirga sp.]